ncbi:MAG: hypothetical protein H6741_18545 [Alphaproteobacteria bacterium]|nr:hypothetical protein [Alphaproteobacteria bacterium]MCB9794715.1 hypothetical protein [Alphaproteobacteria bacterium]
MKFAPLLLVPALALLGAGDAHAACDKEVQSVNKTGQALVSGYESVIKCDPKVAEQVFPQFMAASGDLDTLVALSLVAVEADIWKPVWEMPGKIKDYEVRDEVAEAVGGLCAENEKVVAFLQGAYFGLRDVEFARWSDAVVACDVEPMEAWLANQVQSPPAKVYDDKYTALVEIYVDRHGVDALDELAVAATKAAENNGPYESLLAKMDEAAAPGLGDEPDPAAMKALEDTLIEMASKLPPEKARAIGDRLANSGSDAKAAALLPSIYPAAVKGDGSFDYAAISVEAGECKGVKTAVLHVATLNEPGKRYAVQADAEAPMRTFKPRLKKCSMDDGAWQVVVSTDPITGSDGLNALYDTVSASWAEKGYEVKRRDEKKGVALD